MDYKASIDLLDSLITGKVKRQATNKKGSVFTEPNGRQFIILANGAKKYIREPLPCKAERVGLSRQSFYDRLGYRTAAQKKKFDRKQKEIDTTNEVCKYLTSL
jgi:hypothetical protein